MYLTIDLTSSGAVFNAVSFNSLIFVTVSASRRLTVESEFPLVCVFQHKRITMRNLARKEVYKKESNWQKENER